MRVDEADQRVYRCSKHNVPLVKKEVLYGYPAPGEDYSNVILGGCCVSDDSPKFGFECPVDARVFFLGKSGELIPDEDQEIDEDPEDVVEDNGQNSTMIKAAFDHEDDLALIKAKLKPQNYIECGRCGAIKVDAMELARVVATVDFDREYTDQDISDGRWDMAEVASWLFDGITAKCPVELIKLNSEDFEKWYSENEGKICKFNDPDECEDYVKYSEVVLYTNPCDCFHQAKIPSID